VLIAPNFKEKSLYLFFLLLCAFNSVSFAATDVPEFKVIRTGSLPLYDYGEVKRQDISGAAWGSDTILLCDDGGANAEHQEVRITSPENLSNPVPLLKRQVKQRDAEGMTYHKDTFYVTSSMSQVAEESDD